MGPGGTRSLPAGKGSLLQSEIKSITLTDLIISAVLLIANVGEWGEGERVRERDRERERGTERERERERKRELVVYRKV